MRVLIFAALIAIANSARLKNIAPAFTFSEERSSNGSPFVSIVFPDGFEDTLVLNKYHANEEDRIANEDHCNYLGHLANEPEACVAMTGCFGSEDVHFTILSIHAEESSMFMMTKDGNVEIIDSSFKNGLRGKLDGLVVPREDPDNIKVVEGDEEIIPEIAEAIFAAEENCIGNTCTLPATQHLQIRVGYGDNLKDYIGGSTSHVEAYIKAFWTHLQANFCHSSLGSKVFVERLPGIKHYVGETITRNSLGNMMPHTEADINGADLMLFVGTGGGGVAWVGVICDNKGWQKKYKCSITSYESSHAGVGFVMAHEVGHNLGMFHDFDKRHGGGGNPCDNSGFMSYGPKVYKWSECSVKDFTAKYTLNKHNWCMPAAPNACLGPNPGISCDGEIYDNECCSVEVPCAINQGDCDENSECQGDLVCGKDNCPAPFPSTADCCESPSEKWRDDFKCGPMHPLQDGSPAQCDPNGYGCCSPGGWCGKTPAHCSCSGCIDYTVQGDEVKCPAMNQNLSGNDISSTVVNSWQECGTLCSETSQCEYWTWISDPSYYSWTSSKLCFLKDKSSGLSSKQGVISGAKNCQTAASTCDVSPGSRTDCGFPGISKSDCEKKNCCFNNSIPAIWCFFPTPDNGAALENGGKDCWSGCSKTQGKCDWCGADGWCCRKNWIGNGCDGKIGGNWGHQCVLKPTDLCYQEEITPQEGKWCKDEVSLSEYKNICDGSKTDCVLKGKEKCHSDPSCLGVMYNGASWGPHFKGVKVCKTKTLIAKPGKDWSVYLKCNEETS